MINGSIIPSLNDVISFSEYQTSIGKCQQQRLLALFLVAGVQYTTRQCSKRWGVHYTRYLNVPNCPARLLALASRLTSTIATCSPVALTLRRATTLLVTSMCLYKPIVVGCCTFQFGVTYDCVWIWSWIWTLILPISDWFREINQLLDVHIKNAEYNHAYHTSKQTVWIYDSNHMIYSLINRVARGSMAGWKRGHRPAPNICWRPFCLDTYLPKVMGFDMKVL